MKRVVVFLMVIVSTGVLHSQVYMYGTTSGGGANGRGTIFRTDANGQNFEKVYDFTVATGGNPYAGLTLANDGLLYGFTQTGGQIVNPGAVVALGTFYKFDPTNNMLTVIEYIDDQSPFGVAFADAPILGSDGLLYALSPYNTLVNPTDGKMWSYDVTTGTISILGSIDYVTIGVCDSQLMQASDGKIYFTTRHEAGTPGEFGKIMQFDPQSATFTVLHSSLGATGNPSGTISDYEDAINNPLFEASNGVLYGCSERGGNFQVGNMFKINKDGSGYEVIDFCFSDLEDEGFWPMGGFVERNGLLYSATQQEHILGANSGTFFTIDLTNDNVNYVHVLENEGRRPRGTFVEAANGKFYIQCDGGASSAGSIVEYNPANGLSVATHYFSGTADGADPQRNALCIVDLTDTTPPNALCQDITVSLDQNGAVTITAAQVDNGSNDNQGSVSLSVSPDSFDCSNVGPNTVTLTVADPSGNTATCAAVVTVEDNIAPVAVCQNITVQLDVNGNATITPAQVDDGSTDACGIASLSLDNDTFDCSNVGSNTVVLTVTDASGNSNSCNATVTVEDNISPAITCAANTIRDTDPGVCQYTVVGSEFDAAFSDNCTTATVLNDLNGTDTIAGEILPLGDTTMTWTVDDGNGNTNSCTVTITVTDNEAPVAVCQNITIQLDENGDASITAALIDGGSSDNCAIDTFIASQTNFDCSNVGPNTVTLTVTDTSGNTATCTAVVTVEDNIAPVAVCQNITVQLDVNGNATITPAQVDDGSTDACGIASLSLDNDTFDCSNVGSNTVVLTVTDASGNSNSCNATVTVEDNIAPTMACQDITIQLDANGIATITPADIDNGSTDACGIGIRFLDTTFFDCSNIGTNTVILGIIDVNGNVATCSAVVTVEDTLAPVLECPEDDVVYVEAGTTYSIPDYAAFGDVTATDNCTDPLVISQDPAPGTELSVGTYTVSFETTDDEGNTNSCSFLLIVDELLGNSDSDFDKDLVIFPNPMKNSLTIENSSNLSISEIRLFDAMGRMVMKTNAASNSLDVSGLNSGLYFINIQTDHGLITRKIIKE